MRSYLEVLEIKLHDEISKLRDVNGFGAMCSTSPDYFFPEDAPLVQRAEYIERAREICASCTIIETCAEYAIASKPVAGIWAGLTSKERAAIARTDG